MAPYIFSAEAEDDLNSIIAYTYEEFGEQKVHEYINTIHNSIDDLIHNRGHILSFEKITPLL